MRKNKIDILNVATKVGLFRKNKVALYIASLWLVGATCLISCGRHEEGHHDHDGHEALHEGHDHGEHEGHEHEADEHGEGAHKHSDEIVLDAKKAKSAGVEVRQIKPVDFHGVIHTSGSLMSASCDETTVVATISGRVGQTGHISEGMHIAGGTQLFSLTSADMQMADGDPVQKARIAYEQAKREYERNELLVKDQIVSEKDYQLAKAEYEASRLTYESIRKNRSAGGVLVKAPRAGYVKQCLVKEGDYVEAGQPLMVITQNQHLYLRAEVPERYWSNLNRVVSAKFRTSYSERLYDISEMGGHVQSYAHSSAIGSAYLPIIFEFNNTGDVVQGSYAEVFLITDERHDAITVPLTAITEEQGIHYVYVQIDEDGYRKQQVELGINDGEVTEVVQGLKGGENVVVKGAIQVKLASASNAIPAHTHNH